MKIILEQLMEDIVQCAQGLESAIGRHVSNSTSITQPYTNDAEKEIAQEEIRKIKKEFDRLKAALDAGFPY